MRQFLYVAAFCALAAPAQAANVNLTANLTNSCILTLGTTGLMTAAADGLSISSDHSGGTAATLTVVSIGALPTINFAAPALTSSPAGWSASPTVQIRYTSTGGANQAYTSSASSATLSVLSDAFTIHGKVISATGFAAGSYNLQTVATCSQ